MAAAEAAGTVEGGKAVMLVSVRVTGLPTGDSLQP